MKSTHQTSSIIDSGEYIFVVVTSSLPPPLLPLLVQIIIIEIIDECEE